MYNETIMLTVICTTYNHRKYVESALEGFVNQKTNFKYEVLVHDDASLDGTQDIIKKYALQYPDIIKPIIEKENQYSQHINFFKEKLVPRIRGKYVASCEGDDYWIDEEKIQKQVDFLEAHPEYAACVHNTIQEDQESKKQKVMFEKKDKVLQLKDVVFAGSQSYHTSSIMYRRKYVSDRPLFVTSIPGVGDYPFSIFLVLSGKVKYFGKPMSVYRFGTEGSWTKREFTNNSSKIANKKACMKMLKLADSWSENKYSKIFGQGLLFNEFTILGLEHRYKDMLNPKYIEFNSGINRVKLILKNILWNLFKERNK